MVISFFPSGKYLIVHVSDINPCEYGIAALHGCGLRDDDIPRSFGRLIRCKFSQRTSNGRKGMAVISRRTD